MNYPHGYVCDHCGHSVIEHAGSSGKGACWHDHKAIILDPVSRLRSSRCGCTRFKAAPR